MTNIEQLKTEVNNITNSLKELKDNVTLSEDEKKNKANELKTQAEATKQKIQAEISALDTQTGVDVDRQKTEAQTLLDSFNEIMDLYSSITSPVTPNVPAATPNTPSTTPNTPAITTDEKGFFGKAGDWLGEQRNDVTSGDKWKEEPGKNLLRVAGVGLTGYAVYKGVKALWNWAFGDKDEEANEDEEENEETEKKSKKKKKKSFWKTTTGSVLKWLGIGTAGVGIGWWLAKKLGIIHSDDATDRAEDQAESTLKLKEKDPEKFEKYKGIGENVDNQYNHVMKKEIDAGWGGMSIADGYEKYADKNNINKDTFQATVPMCIDNQFSDVSNFLSEGGYYAYLRGLKFNELKNEIIGWGKEKIGKILGPYLTGLTSFIPFVGKDRSEAITNWFESGDAVEREAELQLFFRQYAKVLNYTQDKLFSLKEKIAEEKILNTEGNHSTASDALRDDEWVENYINTDPRYKNFINGKLHQAVDVMKDNGIFNDTLSHDMEKIKSASDAERDTILKFKDGKDTIQRLETAGDNLTSENYKEGVECCDKIIEDIEDNFDKSRSYLYFGFTHEAFNSKTNNIQEFLKHSGLDEMKSGLKVSLGEFKQKFASGNITKEEISLYKNQVNSYFAMKKEILIGARAIQQMKSDNPNYAERALNVGSAVIGDLRNQTGAVLKHFKDGNYFSAWIAATIPLYLGGKVLSMTGKAKNMPKVEKFGNFIKNSNIFSVAWRSRGVAMRRVYAGSLNKLPNTILKARYNISNGDQLLLQDLIEGKISGDNATKIIEKGNDSWLKIRGDKKANSIAEFMQKMLGMDATVMPAKHINLLFNNNADIVFMRNPNLRKMIFGEPKISAFEQGKAIWNGYRKKIYNPLDFGKVEVLENFVLGKGGSSSIFETLSQEQKVFAKQMMESGNFKTIEEVKDFANNVKKYNLSGLDNTKIGHLVEELINHTDELSDVAKIEGRINHIVSNANISEALKNNRHFNALMSDLNEAENVIKRFGSNQAQIDKQLADVSEFRKSLGNVDVKEIERTSELLTAFKGEHGSISHAIEQFTTLRKLEGKVIDTGLLDSSRNPIKRNIDDIIKSMDFDGLRKLKGKNLGASDDAIESLAKTLERVKKSKVLKLSDNADEILKGVKTFVKLLAKIS